MYDPYRNFHLCLLTNVLVKMNLVQQNLKLRDKLQVVEYSQWATISQFFLSSPLCVHSMISLHHQEPKYHKLKLPQVEQFLIMQQVLGDIFKVIPQEQQIGKVSDSLS